MMTINRNNAVKAACVGGCCYWIAICLSLFFELVTRDDPKMFCFQIVLIFTTWIGAAFYTMIIWTMLRPVNSQSTPNPWSWTDAILGFSPVPFILYWAVLMIHKVVTD